MLYGLMGDCMKFLPNSATSFILSVQLLLHWLCLSDIEEEVLCGTRWHVFGPSTARVLRQREEVSLRRTCPSLYLTEELF